MIKEAVVLAGGFGTRLRSVISDVPKPLAPINGKPFLHFVLQHLHTHGIKHVVLSVGYMHEKIQAEFGSEYLGMKIDYAIEQQAMGTGGGIRLGMEMCSDEHVLAMNGDTFYKVPLNELFRVHFDQPCDATLTTRTVQDGARYGTLQLKDNRITAFREKSPENSGVQLINGGVYAMNRNSFMSKTEPGKNFSIEYDFFGRYAGELILHAFVCDAYFIDIGIPEDYARAQAELGN
jgi:D-glycero-alpha-D-manno-heptose 1-phosphate guanylyltransferase